MVEQTLLSNSSELIYKFPLTNPLFLEYDIILDWPLSKTILVTSFDLLKDERLIFNLQQTGQTLKEYLQEKGLNKQVSILCDTGIFEFEAKKAKLHIDIPTGNNTFTNEEIYRAYEIIGADYIVSPDEIILQSDSESKALQKIAHMTEYFTNTVDLFPKSKIFPVLHGFSENQMIPFLETIRSEGINKLARGGLIPLWNESKAKFKQVVRLSEDLAREYGFSYIHSFGLPSLRVIKDYFYDNKYNSLDTSILYFRTAQRKFLINKGYFISVRYAHFDRCGCIGCKMMMNKKTKTNSGAFAIGLYYHNCIMLNKLTKRLKHEPAVFEDPKGRIKRYKNHLNNIDYNNDCVKSEKNDFMPADKLLFGSTKKTQPVFIKKTMINTKKIPLKILVISSCSKSKAFNPTKIYSLYDLQSKEKRNKILESETETLEAYRMYNSKRINLLNNVIKDLRSVCEKTELYFVSAGFGLIHEKTKIPSYDVSFANKSDSEIATMVENLEIHQTLDNIPNDFDLLFLDLQGSYLKVLRPITNLLSKAKEIVIFNSETRLDNGPIIHLCEFELKQLDQKTNYFSFHLHENLRVSLLKNFFLFLINQDILGKYISFSDWIEKILTTGYRTQFHIRAL